MLRSWGMSNKRVRARVSNRQKLLMSLAWFWYGLRMMVWWMSIWKEFSEDRWCWLLLSLEMKPMSYLAERISISVYDWLEIQDWLGFDACHFMSGTRGIAESVRFWIVAELDVSECECRCGCGFGCGGPVALGACLMHFKLRSDEAKF